MRMRTDRMERRGVISPACVWSVAQVCSLFLVHAPLCTSIAPIHTGCDDWHIDEMVAYLEHFLWWLLLADVCCLVPSWLGHLVARFILDISCLCWVQNVRGSGALTQSDLSVQLLR